MESSPPLLNWVKDKQLVVRSQEIATCRYEVKTAATSNPVALALVKSQETSSGAVIHIYKVEACTLDKSAGFYTKSRVSRSPSIGFSDRLGYDLMKACFEGPDGHHLSSLNPYLDQVPRYLGRSAALDQAVRALLQVHTSALLGVKTEKDTFVYLEALRVLQEALGNPIAEFKSMTLCAVVLLTYVEALGAQPYSTGLIRHAGGISALIKVAGPSEIASNDLGRAMIRSCAGAVVSFLFHLCLTIILTFVKVVDSVCDRKPCFLDTPEWAWVFQNLETGKGLKEKLRNQTMVQFIRCASLLDELRQLLHSHATARRTLKAFRRLLKLRSELDSLKSDFQTILSPSYPDSNPAGANVTYDANFLVDNARWFQDITSAQIITRWWALIVMVNGMLSRVHVYLHQIGAQVWDEKSTEEATVEAQLKADLIFSSIDWTNQYRPIGSSFLSFPLYAAWTVVGEGKKDVLAERIGGLLCGDIPADYRRTLLDYTAGVLLGYPDSVLIKYES